ncbi:hypothetical protein GF362_06530 [Candidatus Dojkabacteria bacterium]|nr:hypothetical protein [Candidatus Dojkabacteria bacterium]
MEDTILNIESTINPTLFGMWDHDGDGIGFFTEIRYGTNPNLADTDGDNLGDYIEIYDPMFDPTNKDSDGDNIYDYTEYHLQQRLNPKLRNRIVFSTTPDEGSEEIMTPFVGDLDDEIITTIANSLNNLSDQLPLTCEDLIDQSNPQLIVNLFNHYEGRGGFVEFPDKAPNIINIGLNTNLSLRNIIAHESSHALCDISTDNRDTPTYDPLTIPLEYRHSSRNFEVHGIREGQLLLSVYNEKKASEIREWLSFQYGVEESAQIGDNEIFQVHTLYFDNTLMEVNAVFNTYRDSEGKIDLSALESDYERKALTFYEEISSYIENISGKNMDLNEFGRLINESHSYPDHNASGDVLTYFYEALIEYAGIEDDPNARLDLNNRIMNSLGKYIFIGPSNIITRPNENINIEKYFELQDY